MTRPAMPALALLFGVALGLLLFWPLRLLPGFERLGVAATSVEGSIWHGRASGVVLEGQPVGDVTVQLLPGPLLRGHVKILAQGGDLPSDGVVLALSGNQDLADGRP